MIDHDAATLPSNWPSQVTYLTRQRYAKLLLPSHKLRIQGPSSPSRAPKCNIVRIQVIQSPDHPAFGQRGLFAAKKVPPSSHILDYFGEVHSDDRPQSDYDLSLLRGKDSTGCDFSIGIDAQLMGNEGRFINDYRGTGASKPNAEFRERIVDGELRMGIWSASRGVVKGEEILVSYGKTWWSSRRKEGQTKVVEGVAQTET